MYMDIGWISYIFYIVLTLIFLVPVAFLRDLLMYTLVSFLLIMCILLFYDHLFFLSYFYLLLHKSFFFPPCPQFQCDFPTKWLPTLCAKMAANSLWLDKVLRSTLYSSRHTLLSVHRQKRPVCLFMDLSVPLALMGTPAY